MARRVALSASHNDCPEAIELLSTCDLIYTTQVHNWPFLCGQFPNAEIKVIPDCTPSMIQFLRERHAGDEVIGLGDLMRLRNQARRNDGMVHVPVEDHAAIIAHNNRVFEESRKRPKD